MADSGVSASDIADYLSSRGCSGTLTDKRLKYHLNVVRQDIQDFTAIPRAGESEAAALIRVLQDFRYQGTCKHISVLLLHASDGECAGCEIENIALRNTAAFAACRDAALIKRVAFDWKGIICGHVTEDSLNVCPCPCEEDDESDDDGRDDRGDDGEANSSRTTTRKSSENIQLKEKRDARMQQIQDHFYRVKAKLESCKTADFWEKADDVDGHILNAFTGLGGVADVAQTVVAHRHRDDPQRHKRRATGGQPRQKAAAVGGSASSRPSLNPPPPPASYTTIFISDSDSLDKLRNDGAPSDSD